MTSTIASQNQRKTFKKRLRKLLPLLLPSPRPRRRSCALGLARLRLPRVDVADAAHGLDPLDLADVVAELLAQVADVHVYAAVEEGEFAAQRRAHEVFTLDDAPRRREQQDEYLVLDVRQLHRFARTPDVARAGVNFNVADRDAV